MALALWKHWRVSLSSLDLVHTLISISDAGRHIPKYLFRVWTSESGNNHLLNTIEKVTPHAFFDGTGHPSVLDPSRTAFLNVVKDHLDDRRLELERFTEFSSWSHYPLFAIMLAIWELREYKDAHLAVLDAEAFIRQHGGTLKIFHVPGLNDMIKAGDVLNGGFRFEYEYLIRILTD